MTSTFRQLAFMGKNSIKAGLKGKAAPPRGLIMVTYANICEYVCMKINMQNT